ncbi:MAG: Hsp70 family protein [Desulfobacterales bacterium]|nr:Hsp70 family protein [Desulfobacterales bacterium]
MEPIVGIDLGTTNSEIAFIINESAEVLKLNDDGIVPSCVGIDNNDQIIVGLEAKNQYAMAPDRTVISVKRLMGTDTKIKMKTSTFLPQEISAFILKSLKERAEKVIGTKVNKAVITVPAYFTDSQRQATREAGEIAGLEVVRIINEPTAAALAYESQSSGTQKILIYDLGGGTFDVSIVKIQEGVVEVLSSTGDNHLGGDDFDDKIIKSLVEHLKNTHKLNVEDNPLTMARLKRAAESAKIRLSYEPYTKIEEDHIGKKFFREIHLIYEMSRIQLEELIEHDLSRTMDSINKALSDANLLASDIDKIILVGGSTRIPKISHLLETKFGMLPHGEIDPDLCVALGAAIQAGREMGIDSTSILLDITPYTFGTSALGEINGVPSYSMFVPIIRRNTKLPTKKSDAFYTVVDNQEAVEVKIYQGEHPDANDNVLIGEYHFKLTKAPAGSVIILDFELDINGILKIKATEKMSGRHINAVIENAVSRFTKTELAVTRKKIDNIWLQGKTSENEELNDSSDESEIIDLVDTSQFDEVIQKAESKLPNASTDDKDDIINLLEDIKDALADGRIQDAADLKKELEDILFYIE